MHSQPPMRDPEAIGSPAGMPTLSDSGDLELLGESCDFDGITRVTS